MTTRSIPPTRSELQNLSQSRLAEAKILLANSLFDGAVYLAGYALELALKARICRLLDSDYPQGRSEFQSFLTHDYGTLIRLAGLANKLDLQKGNPAFGANWSLLSGAKPGEGWSETWRYRRIGSVSAANAEALIDALEDADNGILPWIYSLW